MQQTFPDVEKTRALQSRGLIRRFTVGLVALAGMIIASAHADQLVLKNGDRITGEVKRIWDEEIFIEPDYADEFAVEVDAVAYIDAEREFEIELADGRSITAQLEGVDDEGKQLVVIEGETIAIPLLDLLELEEPEDYFTRGILTARTPACGRGGTSRSVITATSVMSFSQAKNRTA
jgi:hypothetical protein